MANASKKLIYVAGSMRNREGILAVSLTLRNEGFEVFNDWIMPGEETDSKWQEFEECQGHSYAEALESPHADDVVNFDLTWLNKSDGLVLVLPAGKSAHIELGYVRGKGKPAFVYMPEEPERWDIMYLLASGIRGSIEEIVQALRDAFAPSIAFVSPLEAAVKSCEGGCAPLRMSPNWQQVIGSEKVG